MTASTAAQDIDLNSIEQIEMLLQNIQRKPQSYDLAEGALLSTINLSEEKLGKDHSITIHAAFELAKFYRVKRKFAMAESALSRVLEDCERVYGESHVITLQTMCELAQTLDNQKDLERCKAVLLQAYTRYRDSNPYGTEALFCGVHLAHTLEALGMYEDAGLLFLDLVEKYRQANTIQNGLGLNCVSSLISNYCKKAYRLFQGIWKNDDDKKIARGYFFDCVALCQIIASNEGKEAQETLYYNLWPIGKIALWLGDDDTFQNCVWFLDSTKSPSSSRQFRIVCDGCNQQLSSGYHYVCQQCEDHDLCLECFTAQRGQFDTNSESCRDHFFFEISTHHPSTEESEKVGVTTVVEWLSSLLAEAALQDWQSEAAKAGGEEMPLNIDDWNDRCPKDISGPAPGRSDQELHYSELLGFLLNSTYVFGKDGFRSNDLHQWCLTEYMADDSSQTIHEGFSSVILQAQPPQKSLVGRGRTAKVSYSSPSDSMYARFRLDPKMQEIRVLELLPGTGEIQCTLRTVSLLQNPSFEALSYVWGSATTQKKPSIIVEGKRNRHAQSSTSCA
ncbi:het domain protein [Fusarium subglutinans]|uniref:Het domain protein n=1 Tax=Gibberella subglutinans TaxID=42677 RepID=A0A8H5P3I8_GIBSU|nr:het domain protein [Fusarium subglutinans]KAF5588817.1 het domain protein [Fusarium subglutinans]